MKFVGLQLVHVEPEPSGSRCSEYDAVQYLRQTTQFFSHKHGLTITRHAGTASPSTSSRTSQEAKSTLTCLEAIVAPPHLTISMIREPIQALKLIDLNGVPCCDRGTSQFRP